MAACIASKSAKRSFRVSRAVMKGQDYLAGSQRGRMLKIIKGSLKNPNEERNLWSTISLGRTMAHEKYHKLPARDPVTGGELYISEVTGEDSGITMRGKFEIPRYARLDSDQQRFLETFLRCRGMLNSVERELGLSYPTVRARLDSLLEALN